MQAGNFLEHATVYGNSYGLLKSELLGKLRAGKDVLLNVDVQGAATIRAAAEEEPELKRALVTIFLTHAVAGSPGAAVEEPERGRRGGDQETAGGGPAGNRAVEKFRLPPHQHDEAEDLRRTLAIVEAEKMRVARSEAPEMEYVHGTDGKTGRRLKSATAAGD